MKKKLLILLVFLLLLAGVSCLVMQVKKKNAEEKKTPEMIAFETEVKEMYGERNYIGPMTEEVVLLTEEELQELNPNEEIRVDDDMGYIYGRFNKKKIRNAYDAREAAYQALNYIGIQPERDAFLYGELDRSSDSAITYRFPYYYKGVQVYGRTVHVVLDKGNTRITMSNIPKEGITIDSVEPKFTKEDLLAYMEKTYGEDYWLWECMLLLRSDWNEKDEKVWKLQWRVEFGSPNSEDYLLLIDADTGEILGVASGPDY